ncbi:MAG: 16S rRNA (guanine(527)-N(7))-methyltransferase RsmG [Bifidobacteriaceae bacterium]|jgi:16S rRNA (guanine527-N7)-methyltransferase|nr:16S rRNA (guanine(527)-N(7))-methyltransferase RsmG [Bifidobacteriaceae bacterium]
MNSKSNSYDNNQSKNTNNIVYSSFSEFVINQFQDPAKVAKRAFDNIIYTPKLNTNKKLLIEGQYDNIKDLKLSDSVWQKGWLLADLISKWSLMVSPQIAKNSFPDKIVGDKLYINIDDPNIKNVLVQNKQTLLQRINKYTNNKVIKDIYLKIDMVNQSNEAKFFGEYFDKLQNFYVQIYTKGSEYGLIGPKELDNIWDRHIINSASLTKFIKPNDKVCDIGTGGGFPGIVLAVLNPTSQFTFIESQTKRCQWLASQIKKLNLSNVEILNQRAEKVLNLKFDKVTSRAVAPLRKLVPQTQHLLSENGVMLALKGKLVQKEIIEAKTVLIQAGLKNLAVVEISADEIMNKPNFSYYSPARVFYAEKSN